MSGRASAASSVASPKASSTVRLATAFPASDLALNDAGR